MLCTMFSNFNFNLLPNYLSTCLRMLTDTHSRIHNPRQRSSGLLLHPQYQMDIPLLLVCHEGYVWSYEWRSCQTHIGGAIYSSLIPVSLIRAINHRISSSMSLHIDWSFLMSSMDNVCLDWALSLSGKCVFAKALEHYSPSSAIAKFTMALI